MANPLIAIVGRPNVGKSTFFNKVAGRKISITENRPGVTRDRIYASCEWRGRPFTLIDTGGLEVKSEDTMWQHIAKQAEIAIETADVILFFTDGKEGLTASDYDVASMLRRSKKPVILTDYPKEIKAFYMKQNEDGKTVRAMDVLFPNIGEIIGGSEREENYDKLLNRIEELDIPMKDMWWYLDTRRFGTVPHSGFGLGFERLVLFVTGMTNIRDVIPFPRTPGKAEF